ncbi:polysaccharide deactylase family protein, PEP-CTERM locus subfamily [Thiorhodococcus drewsii AZ1]|uniref:Polysaccharide deactylase family protein, PEP-CTERM locus subfamily n=1 Tax=Thiorhodococcus drewsii AZ1 TaxID=765913 RepID=G2E612_9GAMM|nr:XrtA system polysaccharide deacetylase [Thiorhodococcus drewsii]EGV28497.1 polysaccharide deactylase family protein, PEP-CTERM locus subfamily [Thiorhodococcus drewsii AZ1]
MQVHNALTIDVEDYFQVSAFERHVRREDWERLPRRVEANVERVLALLAERRITATFFVLGWIAERHPSLVRRLSEQGHEVASHGYGHKRVTDSTPDEFRADVARTKRMLEDLTGQPVTGYRAPSYSMSSATPWAHGILQEEGYRYSSSLYPISHDHYGDPLAPRFPFAPLGPEASLVEIPIATIQLGVRRLPAGGGGYFRLFPYVLSRWAIRRLNHIDQSPAVFYFHPWEIDPDQPRVSGLPPRSRFRHYLNLDKCFARLSRLTEDFAWSRMDDVFAEAIFGHSPDRATQARTSAALLPKASVA